MQCEDRLIDALAQTHRALVACSCCITVESQNETVIKALETLCQSLAEQTKVLQEAILQNSYPSTDSPMPIVTQHSKDI